MTNPIGLKINPTNYPTRYGWRLNSLFLLSTVPNSLYPLRRICSYREDNGVFITEFVRPVTSTYAPYTRGPFDSKAEAMHDAMAIATLEDL
jgi:hypothetical protein